MQCIFQMTNTQKYNFSMNWKLAEFAEILNTVVKSIGKIAGNSRLECKISLFCHTCLHAPFLRFIGGWQSKVQLKSWKCTFLQFVDLSLVGFIHCSLQMHRLAVCGCLYCFGARTHRDDSTFSASGTVTDGPLDEAAVFARETYYSVCGCILSYYTSVCSTAAHCTKIVRTL